MIPITVTFFTKTKTASTGHAVMNAFVYTVSIILGFALIGFVLSVLLRLLGGGVEQSGFANQLAANPWVNLFFAALYIVFALSLFEIFHLTLPSSFTNRVNRAATGRTDFVGIALKAMVFVLISFTCTAPLIGVLIVQTLGGEWTRPLFGMTAFATGFALPFFVLALVPQMLGSLPKAGGWLFSMKLVMGMLVLAAAFKFISNADLVWLREDLIFTRELMLAIWGGLAAVTAFYLLGFIKLPDDDSPTIGVPRLLVGTTFGIIALYLAAGLSGTRLHGWVEAYLPPDFSPPPIVAGAAPSPSQEWLTDKDTAFALARELNKPIFIDFTGWSCTNCRLMEKNMFPRPEVAARLNDFVKLKLYTDDRTPMPDGRTLGEVNLEYQATTFNTVTLPFYVTLSPEGEVRSIAEYTTNVERFVDFLNRGLGRQELAAK
jgi:thiol:disulfide interchange protein DsbD